MQFDKRITNIEKIKYSCNLIKRLIRGNFKFLFHKKNSYKILVGKHTIIRNKSRIYFDGNLKLGDYVELDGLAENNVVLGKNVSLGNYTIMRGSGRIEELGKGIKIGDNFGCGDFCFFGSAGGIEIGNDVIMGQNVRFHAQSHNYAGQDLIRCQGVTSKGIKIGNNCWIGSGVVFLDGITIGDGCVVGANTVITKSFPDNCVIVGNPGRILKERIKYEKI